MRAQPIDGENGGCTRGPYDRRAAKKQEINYRSSGVATLYAGSTAEGPWKIRMPVTHSHLHEPKVFALVHERKHRYRGREALGDGVIRFGNYNMNKLIERRRGVCR